MMTSVPAGQADDINTYSQSPRACLSPPVGQKHPMIGFGLCATPSQVLPAARKYNTCTDQSTGVRCSADFPCLHRDRISLLCSFFSMLLPAHPFRLITFDQRKILPSEVLCIVVVDRRGDGEARSKWMQVKRKAATRRPQDPQKLLARLADQSGLFHPDLHPAVFR